jgi:hypothetical protein
MNAGARLLLFLTLLSCTQNIDDGYALDITVVFSAMVPDATIAQVTTLQVDVAGAETFHKSLDVAGKWQGRSANLRYKPLTQVGELRFAVAALDRTNAIVASGDLDNIILRAGTTQFLTITLYPFLSSDGGVDLSVDSGADLSSDLASVDLSSVDNASVDLSSVSAADLRSLDLATVAPSMILPPRPKSPQDFSGVTSLHPTLKFELPIGTQSARIVLCSDVPCSSVLQTIDTPINATSATPGDLPANTRIFWRITGKWGGTLGLDSSPTWSFRTPIVGTTVDTSFGITLDVNNDGYDDLAVGALGSVTTGEVLIYYGSAGGLVSPSPQVVADPSPSPAGSYFGGAVAAAGDVDGDGYGDLIVGAHYELVPGKAYVFFGSASGINSKRAPIELDIPASDTVNIAGFGPQFGSAVSTAGDVDGDGYADVMVAALDDTQINPAASGKVWIFRGGPNGPSSTPASTLFLGTYVSSGTSFGSSIGEAGDVNGDGYSDVIVGTSGNPPEGRAYLYMGGPSGLGASPTPSPTFIGAANDRAGAAVAGGGDLNGDGYADVALGAPGTNHVYLFFGKAGGLAPSPSPARTLPTASCEFGCQSLHSADKFGSNLAMRGNFVVTGAICYPDFGACGSGGAFAWTDLVRPDPAMVVLDYSAIGLAGDNFSFGLAIGDYNRDGRFDVIVSAPDASANAGRVELYPGTVGSPFVSGSSTLTLNDGGNPPLFGYACY